MKKIFITLIMLLFVAVNVYAADQTLVDKTAATTVTDDDILYVVDDPGGTAADRKVTRANLFKEDVNMLGSASVADRLTVGDINKLLIINGVDYAQTDTGIEAAIADLPSSGGAIFLPEGTYTLSDDIDINKKVFMFGAGYNSILKLANSTDTNIISLSGAADFSCFTNFAIDGNKANNASNGRGITSSSFCHNVEIKNMYIHDTNLEGIFINGSDRSSIIDNVIESSEVDGIELYSADENKVIGNIIYSVGGNGILVQGTNPIDNIISNNYIYNITSDQKSGIHILGGENNSVNGNIVKNGSNTTNGTNGIFINSVNSTVDGNIISGVYGAGIEIGGDSIIVSDNTISKQKGTAISSSIAINNCSDIIITSNNLSGSSGNGIKIDSLSSNNSSIIVNSNIIKNNGISAVRVFAGSGFTLSNVNIFNNQLFDNQAVATQQYGVLGDGLGTLTNIQSFGNYYDGNTVADVSGITEPMNIDYVNGRVGIGTSNPEEILHIVTSTEEIEIVDAGSTGATEQDWIEVQIGDATGFIRVYSSK